MKRVDANQREIVEVLRQLGASVQHLHAVGRGCPDLLVGWRGQNLLLEIKNGDLPPSRRQLTPDEISWHLEWRGQAAIVESVDDVLQILRGDCGRSDATPN